MNAFEPYTNGAETSNDNEILGLIGGMMDGIINSFEYRGMTVNRSGKSVGVSVGGGRLLLTGASIHDVKDWLDKKAELYGNEA
jgi:hypothetical protein